MRGLRIYTLWGGAPKAKEDSRGHIGTSRDNCQLSPFPWLSCVWGSFFFTRNRFSSDCKRQRLQNPGGPKLDLFHKCPLPCMCLF